MHKKVYLSPANLLIKQHSQINSSGRCWLEPTIITTAAVVLIFSLSSRSWRVHHPEFFAVVAMEMIAFEIVRGIGGIKAGEEAYTKSTERRLFHLHPT